MNENEIITAREFLESEYDVIDINNIVAEPNHIMWMMQEFARLHVIEALKEASEKASITDFYVFGNSDDEDRINSYDLNGLTCSINKESILNSYNLDNIQ